MIVKLRKTISPWILLMTISGFVLGCQNGEVTIKQLDIKVEGISFDPAYANFTTPTIQKFNIEGICSKDVTQVFFRFSNTETWIPVTSTNGSLTCSTDATFKLNFDYPINTIKESSYYTAARNGAGPRLTLEFYGKTKGYRSINTPLIVTQLIERGKNQLSIAPESQMSSPSFKIRGKLSQLAQPGSELTSTSFKIQQGTLRTTAQ